MKRTDNNHGPGQTIPDLLKYAVEIITKYAFGIERRKKVSESTGLGLINKGERRMRDGSYSTRYN